jgi:hypothetical protein
MRLVKNTPSQATANALIITSPLEQLSSLEHLTRTMQSIYIEGLDGSEQDVDRIATALNQSNVEELSKFYDRDATVHSWYYQCYGQQTASSERASNGPQSVARCLQLRGPVQRIIIVKNGPSNEKWKNDLELEKERVARTLWWYIKSGNDRTQVFGEREFARFLTNL